MYSITIYNTFRARSDQNRKIKTSGSQRNDQSFAINRTYFSFFDIILDILFHFFYPSHIHFAALTSLRSIMNLISIEYTITLNNKSNVFDVKCQTFSFVSCVVLPITLKLSTKMNAIVSFELINIHFLFFFFLSSQFNNNQLKTVDKTERKFVFLEIYEYSI